MTDDTTGPHGESAASWRVGADIGGTFTDVVLWSDATGQRVVEKVLTTPDDPARAVVEAVDKALATAQLAADQLSSVIHGTTLVANALIERKGVNTALLTTQGFRDVLEIGREWRYDLFDLGLKMPEPLVPREQRLEVSERIDSSGHVVSALDEKALNATLDALAARDVDSVAVCLLHAYINPAHERAVEAAVRRRLPQVSVSLSSRVSPEMGEYERTSTTVANAYVHPIFRNYVENLMRALHARNFARELLMVLSDGRLVRAEQAVQHPIRLVQSGPAAGAEAARLFAELSGIADVLCFDMGGTTAKACFIPDGEPERTIRFEVARETRFAEGSGLPLQIPAVDMIEIGAGGGSIARIDQRGLVQVGPDSAGASPGPACYGRGGELPTVTDCDLILGYLDAHSFLGGEMVLDVAAARSAISRYLAEPLGVSVEQAAWGVHETVTANMAQAAMMHGIEKALDATRFALLPIGGAGPVHACSMAKKMGVNTLICPVGAGVASAIGMLGSAISFEVARAAPAALEGLDFEAVGALVAEMADEAQSLVEGAGVEARQIGKTLSAMMRYVGQGYEIEVPIDLDGLANETAQSVHRAYSLAYERRYGRSETVDVEVLSWRLVASGPRPALAGLVSSGPVTSQEAITDKTRAAWFGVEYLDVPVYQRAALAIGTTFAGPAIVEEKESTLVMPPAATLVVDRALNLRVSLD